MLGGPSGPWLKIVEPLAVRKRVIPVWVLPEGMIPVTETALPFTLSTTQVALKA